GGRPDAQTPEGRGGRRWPGRSGPRGGAGPGGNSGGVRVRGPGRGGRLAEGPQGAGAAARRRQHEQGDGPASHSERVGPEEGPRRAGTARFATATTMASPDRPIDVQAGRSSECSAARAWKKAETSSSR